MDGPPGRPRTPQRGVPTYRDIAGLCKTATLKEIEAQGWALNPGRYVGVTAGETVWLTQQHMANLFQTTHQNICLHLQKIFDEGEL
jgi:type I restriction-modification system DNA methylase subunit